MPQHTHFWLTIGMALFDLIMRFGHDILMLNRNHRDVEANHLASLAGEVTGRAHHMLTNDLTLISGHFPLTRLGPADGGHGRITINFRTTVTGTTGQCLGQIGGLDIAIIRVADRADDAANITHRPKFFNFFWSQEIDLYTNRAGNTCILPVLVHALFGGGKADV